MNEIDCGTKDWLENVNIIRSIGNRNVTLLRVTLGRSSWRNCKTLQLETISPQFTLRGQLIIWGNFKFKNESEIILIRQQYSCPFIDSWGRTNRLRWIKHLRCIIFECQFRQFVTNGRCNLGLKTASPTPSGTFCRISNISNPAWSRRSHLQ